MKIKKWDKIKVITWADRWTEWVVKEIYEKSNKVLIEWVNLKTKYTKKTAEKKWEMIKKEFPIDVSNVAIICPKENKPTRIWYEFNSNWKKIRVSKKSWEKLDKEFKKS